jgi:hypothetical protein
MKFEFFKKIEEADDVQNGTGETNASQDTNTDTNQQPTDTETNTETTEMSQQLVALVNRKTQLKTQYDSDIKVINDQITLLQKQRGDLQAANVENNEQAQINKGKIININVSLNELANRKLVKKTAYQKNVRDVEQQMLLINKEIAEAGGDVDVKCVDESKVIYMRFSRKLYEAVLNRTDEMYAMIKMSFGEIENLSFQPSSTNCRTFAKNIIAFLNKLGWGSGENEEKFKTFVYNIIDASHISLGQAEKDKFVNNLTNAMKENQLFKWLFMED